MSDNLTYRLLNAKFGPAKSKTLCVVLALGASFGTPKTFASEGGFKVLSFNVQNLFDTVHDPGRQDWAFLPRKNKHRPEVLEECSKIGVKKWQFECFFQDWSEVALNAKIQALTKALSVGSLGMDPDFLVLEEVENARVLRRLQTSLGLKRYPYLIHREGVDPRGIEVAILSRWPPVGLPETPAYAPRARAFLVAKFVVSSGRRKVPLKLIGLHLPSAGNPVAKRVQALRLLNSIARSTPQEELVVAAGDFNITAREERQWRIVQHLIEPEWRVPHYSDCPRCEGSFWGGGEWNKFDLVLVRRSNREEVALDPQVHRSGPTPRAFDPQTRQGVSDHFPVSLALNFGKAGAGVLAASRSRSRLVIFFQQMNIFQMASQKFGFRKETRTVRAQP